MKVLRVASSLHPEVTGGVGLHVHQMSAIQADNGHDVTILTSDNGNRSLPREEFRSGYKIIRHRELARPLDNSIIPGLAKSLTTLSSEFDIIHAHSHLYFSTNIATLLSTVSDIPIAITNHGLFSQTAPQWLQKLYIPTIAKKTFNSADRIFCYTNIAEETLRQRNISTPISVISNGINCDMFSPDENSSEKRQILFVGRLKEGKGPQYLIDAFTSIASTYPDLTLKIVGDGPLQEDLQSRCKEQGIRERVIFAGELSYEEMPGVYNESILLASPTLTEAAVPRVVMEAWACETPVVMSNIPEVSEEHVGDAGSLVPMRDEEAFAKEMNKLVSDPELRTEMGTKGRKRVLKDYSWRDTVTQTSKALQTTINDYYGTEEARPQRNTVSH